MDNLTKWLYICAIWIILPGQNQAVFDFDLSDLDLSDVNLDLILTYRGYACTELTLRCRCPEGFSIMVVDTLLTEADTDHCSGNHGNDTCVVTSDPEVIGQKVRGQCEDQAECYVRVQDLVDDALCPDKDKQIRVDFICVERVYSAMACQDNTLALECGAGHVMGITDVFYGRNDHVTCSSGGGSVTTDCTSVTAKATVIDMCDHHGRCDVLVNDQLLGEICPDTNKYMSVNFTCFSCVNLHSSQVECETWVEAGECEKNKAWMYTHCRKSCTMCQYKAGSHSVTVCDSRRGDVTCPEGEAIRIHSATYGRMGRGHCDSSSTDQVYCPSLDHVQDTIVRVCEGRETCWIQASVEAMTGDPCPGTSKYAQVRYSCQACENVHYSKYWCDIWARRGECSKNPTWMYKNCYKSCSGCNTNSCENIYYDEYWCERWADEGECDTNPTWMHNNCYKSCARCISHSCGNTHKTGGYDCDFWSFTRECQANPIWMAEHCKESCKACERKQKLETDRETGDYVVRACEGDRLTLTCPTTQVVLVTNTFYGRQPGMKCLKAGENVRTECVEPGIEDNIQIICYNMTECEVRVSPYHLGDSVCDNVFKAINITYICADLSALETRCDPACFSHGMCLGRDHCHCRPGYYGELCQFELKHAVCTASGCVCEAGWRGEGCGQPICHYCDKGTCVKPYNCLCEPLWRGDNCSECSVSETAKDVCLPCPPCVKGTCQEPTRSTTISFGCLRGFGGLTNQVERGDHMTREVCLVRCLQENYVYAGLTGGDTCYCGNIYGGHRANGMCTTQCRGGAFGEKCGGGAAISIWRTFIGGCDCDPGWTGELCNRPEVTPPTAPTTERPTISPAKSYRPVIQSSGATTHIVIDGKGGPPTTESVTGSKDVTSPSNTERTPVTTTQQERRGVSPTTESITKTRVTPSTMTVTSDSPVEVTPDREMVLEVILEKAEWIEEYDDLDNEMTQNLTEKVTAQLLSLYNSLFDDLTVLFVIRYRPGSVVITHSLMFTSSITPDERLKRSCMISDKLQQANNITEDMESGTLRFTVSDNLCDMNVSRCEEGFLSFISDQWTCRCMSGYSGDLCQLSDAEGNMSLLIIIVCTIVPSLMLCGLCCVIYRSSTRGATRKHIRDDSVINGEGIHAARRASSRKVFNDSKLSENDETEGCQPPEI